MSTEQEDFAKTDDESKDQITPLLPVVDQKAQGLDEEPGPHQRDYSVGLRAHKIDMPEFKDTSNSLQKVTEKDMIQIVFKNLSYTVQIEQPASADPKKAKSKKPRVNKLILSDLSGVFQPGRLTAIMGASGAGKTSLLRVIAGEANSGNLSGTILINGNESSTKDIKSVSGFVFQDDVILSTMTVKEAITMAALLRLPKTMSRSAKLGRVDEMIKLLNLGKAADTIIGDASIKGVSGGERKRCSMAMELITDPSVLFLDEPTSGLDTFMAYSVVKTLSNLAASGRTVISTIHQPSSETL